jgi:hypothetical protein
VGSDEIKRGLYQMQVTQTHAQGLKREFKVVLAAADLAERVEGQLIEVKAKARIPGFRPGKVPVSHLKRLYGRSIMAEVVQDAVNEAHRKISLRDASLALFGHVPDDEMIMGHGHSRMTGVEIEGDMIASAAEARKIEFLVVVDILNWDHVDRRDQPVFAIERKERARRQRLGLDINHT